MVSRFNSIFLRWFGFSSEGGGSETPAREIKLEAKPAEPSAKELELNSDKVTLADPVDTTTQLVASEVYTETTATPVHPSLVIWAPTIPIEAAYFDWLMGHPGEGSNLATERKVLKALKELLTSDLNDAVLVPRMPSVIPQLLRSLRNKSISITELSQQILKDPALVGSVIKVVNSARYNPADRINSLESAIMMLGEDGLRLLISKVVFNPIINLHSGPYTRRAAIHLWEQSEKCAIASHHLATEAGVSPFQAFLTGLMKNIGMIIAFRVLDQVCEEPKFKYSNNFRLSFAQVAATLSHRIAERWEFPPFVTEALQQQSSNGKVIEWTPLGHLLYTADLISKMRVLVNHAQIMSNDQRLKIGIPSNASDCYDRLNQIQLFDLHDVKTRPVGFKGS
ncbi:HDOD domain-containing protein [Undibacterium sp.]|uniref:HDOD domain-containing protein n=1 Tax=Undibacterium sp. TaxID=1914977 RepID=UPI0037525E06